MSVYSITNRRKESPSPAELTYPTLRGLSRDIDGLFDSFFCAVPESSSAGTGADALLAPRLDIAETPKEFQITLEMPGVEEKDIDVSLTGDVLTIRGEKRAEEKKEDKNYVRIERNFGTFQRSFTLPEGVDGDKSKATFKNGVLAVTIPKKEPTRQDVKKIAVKAE